LLVLVYFLKDAPLFLSGQFIAEDSFYFFEKAYNLQLWESIQTPYAGYLHVLPMLLAELLWLLPFKILPWANHGLALVINACFVAFFYHPACRRLMPEDGFRFWTVVFLALIPFQPNLGMQLGLHWYAAFFTGIFLLSNLPAKSGSITFFSLLLVLIAWSSPATIVFLPLAAYRFWETRKQPARFTPLCFAAASLSYAAAIFFIFKPLSTQRGSAEWPTVLDAFAVMLQEGVLTRSLFGVGAIDLLHAPLRIGLSTLVALSLIWLLWIRRKHLYGRLAGICLLAGMLILVMTMLRGYQAISISNGGQEWLRNSRYLTVPSLFTMTALAMLVAPSFRKWHQFNGWSQRLTPIVAAGLAGLLLWERPPIHAASGLLAQAFPHSRKVEVLRGYEQRHAAGAGQAESLALPGWTPIERMKLQVGGGRKCHDSHSLACIFGPDLERVGPREYELLWLGRFTQLDQDWILHEHWGRVAPMGYSGGFYWFASPDRDFFLSGPAIFPRRLPYPPVGTEWRVPSALHAPSR
jgi:hypothetical protein